jgi:acetylornithine deacetylase
MSAARQRLFDAIAAREDELIHLIQRLVREPSVLGNEMGAQRVVADYLRAGGLEPDVWELPESVLELPGAGNSGVPFTGRHNVAAALPGAGGGRSLVLNGHVDVVSPEPLANWTRDPWAAEIVGRRMYGRGSYDM